jgi:hypothetical protein
LANAVGENAMNIFTLGKVITLLATLITPVASATYYYDTDDIQQRIIAEAKRQNMPPSLALAIAKVESNFDHQALSHAGAKGVMQIMPRTAEQVFGVPRSRLFDPDVNIELGVKFIKKLLKRYDNRLDIALSHYNGGSGVKNRHGDLRVMPATRGYVDKVLATQQDFLQHEFLQHNNRMLFASQANQSGINYFDSNAGEFQLDAQVFDTPSQNPQIETLRALRLHNITRNYKSKGAIPFTDNSGNSTKSVSVGVTLNAKMAKVRQWESIYPD